MGLERPGRHGPRRRSRRLTAAGACAAAEPHIRVSGCGAPLFLRALHRPSTRASPSAPRNPVPHRDAQRRCPPYPVILTQEESRSQYSTQAAHSPSTAHSRASSRPKWRDPVASREDSTSPRAVRAELVTQRPGRQRSLLRRDDIAAWSTSLTFLIGDLVSRATG